MADNHPQVVGQPESSKHFQIGVNALADLLAPTLGPLGGIVAGSSNDNKKIELFDDAATVVRRIYSLGNPQADIGAMLMRNLVWRLEKRVGDGGAMAALLARAIFNEGLRMLTAGANAMLVARGVQRGVIAAVEAIRHQAQPVRHENDLAAVAYAVTNERELGALLGEMSFMLGPDAHVSIEKLVAPYFERRYLAGARYPSQILSMYFYGDSVQRRTVLNAPLIAVADEALTSVEQVLPILEAALQRGATSLVIIAQDVSGSALNLLVSNHQAPKEKKKLDLLAVKLKFIGEERSIGLTDLQLFTGATLLGLQGLHSAHSAQAADLGQAQRVEWANDVLTIVANPADRVRVQQEITALQSRLATTAMDDEARPMLVHRLARLTGGVAELKIGASTQAHRDMLYSKAERALHVLSAAQRGGVVAGAGAALVHAIPAVRSVAAEGDEAMGIELLARALSAPLRQIVSNSHTISPAVVVQAVAEAGAPATFDVYSGQVGDAASSGVLDVADVLTAVVQTAASGALMALTTDAIVYHRKPVQSIEP